MRIKKLYIENYKMFKDFTIDFTDLEGNPLPIVILAGVNGSGKTTLLETLYNNSFFNQEKIIYDISNKIIDICIYQDYDNYINNLSDSDLNKEMNKKQISLRDDSIIYFPSGIDDTQKVADEFVKTFYFFLKEEDYRPSEITEYFNNYMRDIFNGLDLSFRYSHLDKNDKLWFSNGKNKEYYYTSNSKDKNVFTIDELSTGEQTLLSKVLYLAFKDHKNKIILIDEPELSLHPSWQNKVLKIYENFAKNSNCQIIIATHSPHIIGSAKPEYIRVLKKVDDKIEVAQYNQSYGLEFSQILTNIMGVDYLRTPAVAKDIRKLWELLEDENYESGEYKELYQKLEELLGDLDKDMVLSRLEIARIKSRNAKSK